MCFHIGLLPIPRAESEIDVVSAQLCLLDRVCAGAFPPRVRLLRIGGSRVSQRQPRGVREEEGNEVGWGRVTEVTVENIFQPYLRKKKETFKILI